MEPPVKRRRLGENPQSWDDEAEEDDGNDEEWEEYEGDDVRGETGCEHREGSVEQDDGYQLAIEKAYADNRFRATMAGIFDKYGRDFEGIGDEVDLYSGEIVVNNGHIENLRHEVDVGDVPADIDDDGLLLEELTGHEADQSPESTPRKGMDDDATSQSWTSDVDDTEATQNDMQLQHLQSFGPDSVDAISGYGTADGRPSMMPSLYDGGTLRYASSLGEFGASPFAGLWDALPETHDNYDNLRRNGLSAMRSPGYRFMDKKSQQRSSPRPRLDLPGGPRSQRPNALPPAQAQYKERFDSAGQAKRPKASFKQQHNEAYDRKRAMPLSTMPRAEVVEESDTADDAVFSTGEPDLSSDTGDTTDEVPQPKTSTATVTGARVIPDSQDSCASLEAQASQVAAKPGPPQRHESRHQDFDSACMLSDDESPLYSRPAEPITAMNASMRANPPAKSSVVAPNMSADGPVVKRGRGRPRKYPPGYRPPRTSRKKAKPSLPEFPGLSRPVTIPGVPNMPSISSTSTMPVTSLAPTTSMAQPVRTEPVSGPGLKRKRGRPRKDANSGTVPQDQTRNPAQQQAQQPMYQQPYLHAFQPGLQQQGYQFPFHPMFQQPYVQFPQAIAYQPFQHPMVQFQQQTFQPPMQQFMQQPMLSYPQPLQRSPTQPVKRKRGRPRKYPVRFDSVYPGYVMNRKRNASNKMHDGLPFHQQLPGLQNSMTALLSGQSGRMMVSEDAWYGVARQLAQDIACLQGGFSFGSQFQAGGNASDQNEPRSSPRKSERRNSSLSMPQETDDEPLRVTELSEVSDAEITPLTSHTPQNEAAGPAVDVPALTDQALFELSPIDTDRLDTGPMDMFDRSSVECATSAELTSFDPAMIDPALTEQAPIDTSASEASWTSSESDTFDPSLVDPALLEAVASSPMKDDDAGFVVMESPKTDTPPRVQPASSPPSPPLSILKSSPWKETGHRTPSPMPTRLVNDQTPVSLESARGSTPAPREPDNYDLPSSPEMPNNRKAPSASPSKESTLEQNMPTDLPSSVASTDIPDPADPEEKETCERPAFATAELARATELQPGPISVTTIPINDEQHSKVVSKEPLDQIIEPGLEILSEPVKDLQQFDKQASKAEEQDEQPPQPTEPPQGQDGTVARFETPPKATRPRTPEPSKSLEMAKQTPKKPATRRSPKVPRSTERCTPLFVEPSLFVASPTHGPPKKHPTVGRRTMGELKQAILEPWHRAPAPRPAIQKSEQKQKPRPDEPGMIQGPKHAKPRTSLPQVAWAQSSKPAKTQEPTRPKPSVSKPTVLKPPTSHDKASKVVEKPHSRRSLLSLVSADVTSKDLDDEVDELDTPLKSRAPSSTKPSKSRISSSSSRDTGRKEGHSIADSQHARPNEPQKDKVGEEKPQKDRRHEKERGKERRRKRRHTDGSSSKSRRRTTSGGDEECGVNGYTCNKDFCFTCL